MASNWPFQDYLIERMLRRDSYVQDLYKSLLSAFEKSRDQKEELSKAIHQNLAAVHKDIEALKEVCKSDAPTIQFELETFRKTVSRYDDVHLPDLNGFLQTTARQTKSSKGRIVELEGRLERQNTAAEDNRRQLKRKLKDTEDREAATKEQLREAAERIKRIDEAPWEKKRKSMSSSLGDEEFDASEQSPAEATLRKALEEEKEKQLCQICFQEPKDSLVKPCLHFLYCRSCLTESFKLQRICPACRSQVSEVLKCIM